MGLSKSQPGSEMPLYLSEKNASWTNIPLTELIQFCWLRKTCPHTDNPARALVTRSIYPILSVPINGFNWSSRSKPQHVIEKFQNHLRTGDKKETCVHAVVGLLFSLLVGEKGRQEPRTAVVTPF